jgi:hypothetical protein
VTTNPAAPHASQLKTIVTLFVVLRVTILFLYTPQGLLNAYTDYHHYFRVAQLSEQGYYPFVNMWSEHPPLQVYTNQVAYSAARTIVPMGGIDSFGYQIFARLLGAMMLLFDAGVLILIHRIAQKVWGLEQANWSGWVYATLSVPLFFWNASQTSDVVFFSVLALYWFIVDRRTRSAVAVSLGIAYKIIPVFLLGLVVRGLWPKWKAIGWYVLVVAIVLGLIFAPFVALGGGPWITASLAGMFTRASYATPWALLDGNWGVGDVGDVPTRTQLDLATRVYGNPPVIPSLLVLALFASLYLWLFRRPIEAHDPRHAIWFSTLMLMLFHLWSKGWSPQWATLIIPFILLSFPNQRGIGLILLLTGLVFLEWPLADALQSRSLLTIAIVGRTALFVYIGVRCGREFPATRERQPHWF